MEVIFPDIFLKQLSETLQVHGPKANHTALNTVSHSLASQFNGPWYRLRVTQ